MRQRWQRGMTLVELLVSMAVTAILLVGLGSALLNVSGRYQSWVDHLNSASTGDALTAGLQADSHRYVPCAAGALGQRLDLCAPDRPGSVQVTYTVTGTGPYVIGRQAAAAPASAFLARSQALPSFAADCLDSGATISGHIVVRNLRSAGDSISLFYSAPWKSGCA